MNRLEKIAKTLGATVRAYHEGRDGQTRRARFIAEMARAAQWGGGNYLTEGAQRRAMTNSWIYAAVGMIAREVSAAEFKVQKQAAVDDEPLDVPNHPLELLLWQPNPFMSKLYLWQFSTLWLELSGNAYWFLATDTHGRINEIWPLPSAAVDVMPGESFIDYYEYTANGQAFRIPGWCMVHFQLPNPFDVFRGLSPLVAAMLPTDSDLAMARWNGTFFGKDNVMPSAIINLSSGDPNAPIDPADAEALKQQLRSDYQAAHRKTAITNAPGGVDVTPLGWSAKDMDFLSGRQFTKDEIFAIYGVPGGLFDKNATEANATVADKTFKEKTIWPLLLLLAEQLTAQVTMPFYGADMRAAFGDIRQSNRALELQEVSVAGPYLTVDEIRERYWQLEPLPAGDGAGIAGAGEVAPTGFFREGDYP